MHGSVTGTEINEACLALIGHPDWEADDDELWDLTEVSELGITPGEVQAIARTSKALSDRIGTSRVAVVSSKLVVEPIVILLDVWLRHYGKTLKQFDTLEAATVWLDEPAGQAVEA